MPPKKKGGKGGGKGGGKKDKGAASEEEPGPESDPLALLASYSAACRTLGLAPHESVRRALMADPEDNPNGGRQVLIEPGEEEDGTGTAGGAGAGAGAAGTGTASSQPLGPGGCRALALAVSGADGYGLPVPKGRVKPAVFTALEELRMWRSGVGDYGAVALADMLRIGGTELKVSFLEVLGDGVGVGGAMALGRSLSVGMNRSLVTLILDFNPKIGSDGASALCRGLRTNSTLKRLSLRHCSIAGGEGGAPLGEMLSFPRLAITTLDLGGNLLGGGGVLSMSPGLSNNKSLATLLLADNAILSTEADVEGLEALASALVTHPSLTEVDLLRNPIGNGGGAALLRTLGKENKRLSSLKVDTGMDKELYKAVFRDGSGGGGKKKKKKGGGGGKKKSKKKK